MYERVTEHERTQIYKFQSLCILSKKFVISFAVTMASPFEKLPTS